MLEWGPTCCPRVDSLSSELPHMLGFPRGPMVTGPEEVPADQKALRAGPWLLADVPEGRDVHCLLLGQAMVRMHQVLHTQCACVCVLEVKQLCTCRSPRLSGPLFSQELQN